MLPKYLPVTMLLAVTLAACGKSGTSDTAPEVAGASSNVAGMPELAIRNGCTSCHAIDRKVVGPAWRDVANKYKNAKTFFFGGKEYPLQEGLVIKVSKGGAGNWGSVPMIANDPGSSKQAEIEELVKFVLSLAK